MKWQLTIKTTGVPHPFVDLRTERGKSLAFMHDPDMADLARFRMMQAAPEMTDLVGQIARMTTSSEDGAADYESVEVLDQLIVKARSIQKEQANEPR